MSLSEDLAKTCLLAKKADSYPAFKMPAVPGLPPSTPEQVRDAFENSVVDEEALRARAGRFGDLAQSRADNNENTAGSAFAKRLLPVPHTGGEAAWRLPLVGLGAIGGHGLGEATARRFSTPSTEAIHEVVNREGGPLASRIEDELVRGGAERPTVPPDLQQQAHQAVSSYTGRQGTIDKYKLDLSKIDSTAQAIQKQMDDAMHAGADPKAIEKFKAALQKLEIQRAGVMGPLQSLEKAVAEAAPGMERQKFMATAKPAEGLGSLLMPGEGGPKAVGDNAEKLLSTLRGLPPQDTRAVLGPIDRLARRNPNHARVHELMGQTGLTRDKLVRMIDSIRPSERGPWAGRAGAAAGALGAGALTGLPLAIRAARLNSTGGEAAHRAREQMRGSIEKAEHEQFKRENMLNALDNKPQMPNKEFRNARNVSRKNWKESIKGYRKSTNASAKNEKKTGSPVASSEKKDDDGGAEKRSSQLNKIRLKFAGIDFQPSGETSDIPMAALSMMQNAGKLAPGLESPLKYPIGMARGMAMQAAPLLPKSIGNAVTNSVGHLENSVGSLDKSLQGTLQAGKRMAGNRAQQLASMARKFLFRK